MILVISFNLSCFSAQSMALFACYSHQVLHDTATFKYPYCLCIGKLIRDGWNASVRIDFEEPIFLLRIFGELYLGPVVW